MAKKYPFDLVNGGEESYLIYSLGHHDLKSFARAVAEFRPSWPMGEPMHSWGVRAPRKGYSSYYYPCPPTHSKAVPMTVAIEDHNLHRQRSNKLSNQIDNKEIK